MTRKLKLTLVGLFCLTSVSGLIAMKTEARQNPQPPQEFRNLQALRGISAADLWLKMGSFNIALGVNCDYCHAMDALEKGDKPAHKVAFKMIGMTAEINKQQKDVNIDCNTCHQGKSKPPEARMVPVVGPGPGPGPGPGGPVPPGDDRIIPASATYGNVPFPHAKHMAAVSDCAACHHTGENNKCSTCHLNGRQRSQTTTFTGYDVMHARGQRSCFGCHDAKHVGPRNCAQCHKRG